MLKVQVSIPELKAHAEAIRAMAMDPMKALQTLAGDLCVFRAIVNTDFAAS